MDAVKGFVRLTRWQPDETRGRLELHSTPAATARQLWNARDKNLARDHRLDWSDWQVHQTQHWNARDPSEVQSRQQWLCFATSLAFTVLLAWLLRGTFAFWVLQRFDCELFWMCWRSSDVARATQMNHSVHQKVVPMVGSCAEMLLAVRLLKIQHWSVTARRNPDAVALWYSFWVLDLRHSTRVPPFQHDKMF